MKAAAIIFANLQNEMLDELTRKRTTASLPFGGRYRLIDFALSNIVSADIVDVGVIAQKNYQSLMDHVGSGKDWDLSRRNGGLSIFPPFSNYKSDFLSTNRLEALKTIMGFISKVKDDTIVLMDCDSVNVINFDDILKQHAENKADITVMSAVFEDPKNYGRIIRNLDQTLKKIVEEKDANKEEKQIQEVNAGIYCVNWKKVKKAFSNFSIVSLLIGIFGFLLFKIVKHWVYELTFFIALYAFLIPTPFNLK